MIREHQLLWVQKNSKGQSDIKHLAKLVKGFHDSPRMARLMRQRLIVDAIERYAGMELMSRIEWMEQAGSTLVFYTKETSDCYMLGIRWRQKLLRAVQRGVPQSGIREIRFLSAEGAHGRRE